MVWSLMLRRMEVIAKKTVYVIIGIKLDGKKDLLGFWIGERQTAKFWLTVINLYDQYD